MAITASLVKELREKTNVGMMECKKALSESQGDLDEAVKLLRERGTIKAAKKAGRAANEGTVKTQLSKDGKTGILFSLNCETDFVSRNDNFKTLVDEIAHTLLASTATSVTEALKVSHLDSDIDALLKVKILELGENLILSDFTRFSLCEEGQVVSYIHMGGKVGVLLKMITSADFSTNNAFKNLAKDITLHIAAANPAGLNREDIPQELVEAEKDIFRKQMENENKPDNIIEKIILGKLAKFYSEQCLTEQGFVKDPSVPIKDLIAQTAKDLNGSIQIAQFSRVSIG